MKRKLTPQEMMASENALKRLEEEKEYDEYQLEICDLKLTKGLMQEYKKEVRNYKKVKKEFTDELKMANEKIKILKDQMRNGVEIKEDKKEEEDGRD